MNTSQQGFTFENEITKKLLKVLGGRTATLNEQLKEQIDYITESGHKIDIKYQPKAHEYKTVNVELFEYNPDDLNDIHPSYVFTSTADVYIWETGKELLMFDTNIVKDIAMKYLDDVNTKIEGVQYSPKNSDKAVQMAKKFKKNNRVQAATLRISIEYLKNNGAVDLNTLL